MDTEPRQFLEELLVSPRPSGYERPVQDVVRKYVGDFAERVETDLHGNVVASIHPESTPRFMLAGHCDQIGMLITHIDELGFVYAETIGGWDPQQLIGQRMTIWTDRGPVPAVIARKPIHLLTDDEKRRVVRLQELWLDIGAASEAEARELVGIGDPVTLALGLQPMQGARVNGPGLDNASGLWVVIEALRRAGQQSPRCGVFAVSTVQEEIGLRGAKTSAYRIDPRVAIAVDVTHATDCPTIDKSQRGDVRLDRGPVIYRGPNMNPRVVARLVEICERENLPYQLAAIGRATPNDANSLQVNREGVAVGLVAIPNRYMHSAVEMVSLDDLDHAATLLACFAAELSEDDDFTP